MDTYQAIFERHEKKYLLTAEQYRQLRERLKGLVRESEYYRSEILNLYYDTPNYRLIRTSLEKPKYKEKLRLRSYRLPKDDTQAFIEIKKKCNGIVYKRRVGLPYGRALMFLNTQQEIRPVSQISKEIDYMRWFYQDLSPKMLISYDREAYEGIAIPGLRITFDTNIRWQAEVTDLRDMDGGNPILQEGQILMETKILDAVPWELSCIFSELHIFPTSFSKYGMAYMAYTGQRRRRE